MAIVRLDEVGKGTCLNGADIVIRKPKAEGADTEAEAV